MIRINGFNIDLATGAVQNDQEQLVLPPRLHALLKYFVENPNQLIERDALIKAVWGHLEAASDDSVNVAVSSLRRALGDQLRPHKLIQTIPRRGYRFNWELSANHLESTALVDAVPYLVHSHRRNRWLVTFGLLAGLVACLLWFVSQDRLTREKAPDSLTPATTESAIPSVAVLPFSDLSEAGNQVPFTDGLADRIIHLLAHTDKLVVPARTSTFRYRDSDRSIAEIGQLLNVQTVLEGSVQRSGEQLRVIAQLIDVKSDSHVWSRQYDREIDNVFEIQDDIANQISETLTSTLLPESARTDINSIATYSLIAKARRELDSNKFEGATRAIEFLDQALVDAPNYVEALVLRYDAEQILSSLGSKQPRIEADKYLKRAEQLAPNDTNVLRALGNKAFVEQEHEDAISLLRKAIEAQPNNAAAYFSLGQVLYHRGEYQESLETLRAASELDPASERVNVKLADAYWAVGQSEEAVFRLRENIRRSPSYAENYDRLSTYLAQLGQVGEAMRVIRTARHLDPESSYRWFRECEFYLQIGDDVSAEACTDALDARHDLPIRMPYLRQIIAGFRGDEQTKQDILRGLVELAPENALIPGIFAESLATTDCDEALLVLKRFYNSLFLPEPELNTLDIYPATTAVFCLQRTGQHEQKGKLLAALERTISRVRLQRGPWLINGIEHVKLLILQGKEAGALTELGRVIDSGWRYYWWSLDRLVYFRPFAERAEFKQMIARLKQGVEAERNYFEANQDAALFGDNQGQSKKSASRTPTVSP